jgi:hypothetical protein
LDIKNSENPDQKSGLNLQSIALTLAGALVLLAVWIQYHTPLNLDAGYYMRILPQILSGDFWFGDDSPSYTSLIRMMVYLLFFPPMLFTKLTGITDEYALKGYMFVLSFGTLFFLTSFVKQLTTTRHSRFWFLIPIYVFFALVWPVEMMGEKEHFFFLLILPYVLSVATRVDGLKWQQENSILIGIAAGIAVVIKPQFLIIWFVLEAYKFWVEKKFRAVFSTINIWIAVTATVFYVWAIWQVFQVGITPFLNALHFYNSFYVPSWEQILLRKLSLLWVLVGLIILTKQFLKIPDRKGTVLFLAFASAFSIVIISKFFIDYHWYPSAGFAGLFVAWTAANINFTKSYGKRSRIASGSIALLTATFFILVIYRPVSLSQVNFPAKTRALEIASIIKKEASGEPVMYLGMEYFPFYPAINYANLPLASRFSSLFFITGFREGSEKQNRRPKDYSLIMRTLLNNSFISVPPSKTQAFSSLINAIIKDFDKWRPRVIMIAKKEATLRTKILSDPAIKAVLKNYKQYAEFKGHIFMVRRN